jgi:serine protease Do
MVFSSSFVRPVLLLSLAFFLAPAHSADDSKEARPKRGTIELGKGARAQTDPAQVNQLNGLFSKVVESVSASVVSINTEKKWSAQPQMPFDNRLYEFFGIPQPQVPDDRAPKRNIPLGGGSGVIASKSGHILTNAHVVEGADVVKVRLTNQKTYTAKVLGVDKKADVAIIQIDAPAAELRPAAFGDSRDIQIGEWVMAIGTPFALQNTVTSGIISAKGRREQATGADSYQDFIQTDAAVNPGNSGGPLVNLRGEVVGINSSIYTRTGGFMGVSFAIPINMAVKVAEDLIYDGKVTRGFLGVSIDNVDENLAGALGLPGSGGCLIREVTPGSPAAKGGLKAGDIVLKADGVDVLDAAHLRNLVADLRPGQSYPFETWRDGKKITLSLKVGPRPGEEGPSGEPTVAEGEDLRGGYTSGKLGLRFESVEAAVRKRLELPADLSGAAVTEVTDGSPAAENGLLEGMVITHFKRKQDPVFQPVQNAKQLSDAAKNLAPGDQIAFMIYNKGKTDLRALRVR